MIQAERVVIDAIISGDEKDKEICMCLAASDFENDQHRKIFQVAKTLYDRGIPPDFLSVGKHVKLDSDFIGSQYRDGMALDYYVCKLRRRSEHKRLNKLMISFLKSNEDSVDEIKEKLMHECRSITTAGVSMRHVAYDEKLLESYQNHVANLKQNMLKTTIIPIDEAIRGIAPGEVLTIIARAASYKTAFLSAILQWYALSSLGAGSLYFSLEMPIASLTERYYQGAIHRSGRAIEDMYSGEERNQKEIEKSEKRLLEHVKGLYVVDRKVTLDQMASYFHLIQREKGKIGCIGIDYLGLVDADDGGKEYETISKIARGVKDLAKDLNVPIVLLSQVNRAGQDGETEITLSMGRGSGAIEEAADCLLGLWRYEKTDAFSTKKALVCKILKNRKGAAGGCWSLNVNNTEMTFGVDAEPWEAPKKEEKNVGYNGRKGA